MDGVLWPLLSRAEESVSGDVAASTPGMRCELVGRVAKEGLPPAAQLELLRRMAVAAVGKGRSVTGAAWSGGGGAHASVGGREEVEWTEPVVKLVHTLLGLHKELPQVISLKGQPCPLPSRQSQEHSTCLFLSERGGADRFALVALSARGRGGATTGALRIHTSLTPARAHS
jgi:hypothetical protein